MQDPCDPELPWELTQSWGKGPGWGQRGLGVAWAGGEAVLGSSSAHLCTMIHPVHPGRCCFPGLRISHSFLSCERLMGPHPWGGGSCSSRFGEGSSGVQRQLLQEDGGQLGLPYPVCLPHILGAPVASPGPAGVAAPPLTWSPGMRLHWLKKGREGG